MTAQTATKPASTKVITGRVRASYVHVFKARVNELSGNEEYSLSLLIPKRDTDTVARLRAAIDAAIVGRWSAKPPPNLRHPLRDGDTEKDDEAYAGHWFVNVKSQQKPGVVDLNLETVIDPNDFVSGDYCRASLNCFAYDKKGNRGTSFGLNNLQVLDKGEPLSNRARAEDDFSDGWSDDGATATATEENPW